MKFIDEALITVKSGDGGHGCVSFRREKFVPKGGPDGGDGGRGGDVVLKATTRRRTLQQFQFKRQFQAPNGGHGQGRQKTGRSGQDLVIELPPGTLVKDADTGELIADLVAAEQTFVAAQGGRGGQGNKRFATSTHQAPRFAQPGEVGIARKLKLELKLLADVGLVGLPNAGKSTLISVISSARPKIADYPFTTLTPNLGVVQTGVGEPFVVADIPGLIQGAHQGAGLGTRFLRHIERTRILVHLIDASQVDPDAPLSGYQAVSREMTAHSPDLAQKPVVVVLSKLDLPAAKEGAACFEAAAADMDTFRISAATGEGIEVLKKKIATLLDRCEDPSSV